MPKFRTFKCTLCNVVCFSQESFDQHNLDQHPRTDAQWQNLKGAPKKSEPLDVVCRVCNHTFTSATQLVQHKLVTGHVSVQVLNPSGANQARAALVNSGKPKTRCEDCNIDCVTLANLQSHLNGARHRQALKNLNQSTAGAGSGGSIDTQCAVCDLDCGSAHNLQLHLNGSRHRSTLQQNQGANTAAPSDVGRGGRCDICDMNCGSFENLQLHLGGSKHKRKVELRKAFCRVCNLQCQSLASYNDHIAGSRHEKRLRNFDIDVSETEPYEYAPDVVNSAAEPSKQKFWCEPCQLDLRNVHNWKQHINGAKHARNVKRAALPPPTPLPPPPPCNECGVSFKTVEERARHMKSAEHRGVRERVNEIMEKAFNSLETMNEWLIKLGEEPESTRTKAKAALSSIHINIYDLANKRFDKRQKNLWSLRRYTRENDMYYPKGEAKGTEFRHFLRHLH